MKKKDLKTGMQVELRNGERYIILLKTKNGDMCYQVNGCQRFGIETHEDDLTYMDDDLDIMSVYDNNMDEFDSTEKMSLSDCIWKRKSEKMIEVGGKMFSESTIKESLKAQCNWD